MKKILIMVVFLVVSLTSLSSDWYKVSIKRTKSQSWITFKGDGFEGKIGVSVYKMGEGIKLMNYYTKEKGYILSVLSNDKEIVMKNFKNGFTVSLEKKNGALLFTANNKDMKKISNFFTDEDNDKLLEILEKEAQHWHNKNIK